MRTLIHVLIGAAVVLGACATPLPAGAAPAAGHTYTVNSTLDEPDADPTTGNCISSPSGLCTLRAAIMGSDYATGPNTIILPAGTYTLTRPGYDDAALLGDLDIGHDLTLQGAGSAATIVDGNGAAIHDRVFQILNTAQNVTLSGLTIRHGQWPFATVQGGSSYIGGGGLYLEGAGHVRLSDVIIEGNTAAYGGGLNANFSNQGGSLEMDQVIVRGITAPGPYGFGGGVLTQLGTSLSKVTVRDSQVYGNMAEYWGGGFGTASIEAAHWSIEHSVIYSNTAAYGGGIANWAQLDMFDSQLHDNHATQDGGAIEAYGPLTLTRTTLATNTAGALGGGLNDWMVQTTLINSTLSDNVAGEAGGGLYLYGGRAQIANATIAGNQVYYDVSNQPALGAGMYLTHSVVLTATNSIIAENLRISRRGPQAPDDCSSVDSTGGLYYNLFTNQATLANCTLIYSPLIGNGTGQDPLLGPLQDNGGPTPTRALLPGSPAIEAGDPAGCTDAVGAPITVDQRDAPRTDGHCDIGAFEVVPEADVSVGRHDSSDPVPVGAPLTYTLAVTNTGPETATGVVLTDTLPLNATLGTTSPSQGSCVGVVVVTCNLGSLASGDHLTVTVAVTPTAAGLITNTALVSANNEFDPQAANNSATETTTVVALRRTYLPLVRR